MIRTSLTDRLSFDTKSMRKTTDGYLVASPRVARTGIQQYLGSEIGGDLKDRAVVRVLRPEEEVFHKDAVASMAHKPLTNDHPSVPVTADNWSKFAVGQTDGDVLRDQEFVRVPMMFTDARAVAAIEGGKRQLSVGYTCDIEIASGTTDDGQEYDAIQRNIRVNHVALVKSARGGSRLAVGDELPVSIEDGENDPPQRRTSMTEKTLRTMTVDGISVEMTDTAIQVVQKALNDANARIEQYTKDLKTARDTADKQVADLTTTVTQLTKDKESATAEIATLKKQLDDAKLTPQQIDQLVADRQAAIGKAAALLGDKLVIDGKSDAEIRRQVVDAKLGDAAKGWSDDQIATSFATLTVGVKAVDTGSRAVTDARSAFAGQHQGDNREKAYGSYEKRLQDAWRGDAAGKA